MGLDAIQIQGLTVMTKVGVPDEERSTPQEVAIDVVMVPLKTLSRIGDSLEHTIDYYEASVRLTKLAAKGERKLIETLAEDLLQMLLLDFPVKEVRVTVRKFVIPNADFVSVSLSRSS